MYSARLSNPTSLRDSQWTSDQTWNTIGINIEWVRLAPCSGPKLVLREANGSIRDWRNCTFCFSVFFAIFDKHVIIYCVLSMFQSRYLFRKLDVFFPGKQQGAIKTDRKCFLFYHFCMAVTIFKAATSLSIF